MAALASRPEDFGRTARYSSRVTAVAQGSERLLSGADGVADFRVGRANGQTLSVGDDNRTVTTDFFVDGTNAYTRRDRGAWTKRLLRLNELDSPVATEPLVGRSYENGEPVYARDRGLRHEIFNALVTRVEDRGTEMIHGVATRHYSARLDMARARGSLPQPVLREMAAWAENEPPGEVELWVDGTGRLRRTRVLYDGGSSGVGFRVDTEWWDHDSDRHVEVPPTLDDPIVLAGPGVTSFRMTGDDSEPEVRGHQGQPGFSLNVLDVGGLSVSVFKRTLGGDVQPVSFQVQLGPQPTPPLPVSIDYRPFGSKDLGGPWWTVSDPHSRCDGLRPSAGTLSVQELIVDGNGVVARFRAALTMSCRISGGGGVAKSSGEIRYHALG